MNILKKKPVFLGSFSVAAILLAVIPVVTFGDIPRKNPEEAAYYLPDSDPLASSHVLSEADSRYEAEHAERLNALLNGKRPAPLSRTVQAARPVTISTVSKTPAPAASPPRPLTADQRAYLSAQALGVRPNGPRPQGKLYPELKPICACESSYEGTRYGEPRQYEFGKVLLGYRTPDDIGICQINEPLYGAKALSMGYDILTEAGNIGFANWLFEQEGAAPWYKSRSCWE